MTYIQHDGGGANRGTFFLSKFGSLDVSQARHQSWCRKGAHMPYQLSVQHDSEVGGGPGRGHGRGDWCHTETCQHLYDSRLYQILIHMGAVYAHTCSRFDQGTAKMLQHDKETSNLVRRPSPCLDFKLKQHTMPCTLNEYLTMNSALGRPSMRQMAQKHCQEASDRSLTIQMAVLVSSKLSGRLVTRRHMAEKWLSRPQGEPSGVCTGHKKPQASGISLRTVVVRSSAKYAPLWTDRKWDKYLQKAHHQTHHLMLDWYGLMQNFGLRNGCTDPRSWLRGVAWAGCMDAAHGGDMTRWKRLGRAGAKGCSSPQDCRMVISSPEGRSSISCG